MDVTKTKKHHTPEDSHRPRRLVAWKNRHDNGWSSNVIENADGTFSAWAAPDAGWPVVDYVEDAAQNAKRAADYALARKSGHEECSPLCSGWLVHIHDVH